MGNATSRQKCPMRPIAQFKTPWLLCDLLFRCGGQFDLGGWVGCTCWDGMGCAAMRCVARRCAVFVTVSQSGRSLLIDRPIFLPPFDGFCLAVVPAACFPPVAQLAIDAGSAALDWTRLRSCEQHTCNAAQTRHPQKLGSGVVLWWIGTVLGPRSFGPFSLIGWLLAGVSAVNAGQVQAGRSRVSIIQLLGAAATDEDETRQDKTPVCCACSMQRALYQTAKERRGAERRGVVERSGGTGIEARFRAR